ncbi:unnamed protein product [Toxocara canis]|uniref:FBD domain-containing protein n=1 Tax=Toxocara canis TaxID=6265 RepID=A0A183V9G5_TOXCA|nr:unnamed protein product [Toxocara canis]
METIINETMFAKIVLLDDQVENFEDGLGKRIFNLPKFTFIGLSPVDGIDFAVEVPKVKGGGMLWSILDNFDLKLFCNEPGNSLKSQCKWMNKLKYYAYSAVLFRRNYTSNFEEVTHMINGCENLSNSKCSYKKMHQSAETFYPGDVAVVS